MRLIDAEAFYEAVEKEKRMLLKNGKTPNSSILVGGLQMVLEWINEQPTIEAKPVVHTHWEIEYDEDDNIKKCYCSNCGVGCEPMNYCGFCGAQMDEVASDTNVGSKGVKIPVMSMKDICRKIMCDR